MNMPQIEFAGGTTAALDGYRSLARHTGVPVTEVARLAEQGELRSLFRDGRLRSREELRSRFGTPIDGREAVREMMRKRPGGEARTELARLRAKRRLWTYP
jgi:hypothetical protein